MHLVLLRLFGVVLSSSASVFLLGVNHDRRRQWMR